MERRVEAEHRKLEVDSDSESWSSEEEEVAFHIKTSEVTKKSNLQIAASLLCVVGDLAWIFTRPEWRLDVLPVLAVAYIFGTFSLQNSFLEWPEVPCHILLLLAMTLGDLAAPTLLQMYGYWNWYTTCGVWALSVVLLVGCYRLMVRGPAPKKIEAGQYEGKTFVITGCNTGIGYETAKELALGGATVVFACRSEDRARAAMERVVAEADGDIDEEQLKFMQLDTSSFASVRRFVETLRGSGIRPYSLILNAGVMMSTRKLSEDGIEMTMATNHFGHFLLVNLMLPMLREAEARGEKPRIVIVGSNMSYFHGQFDFSECMPVDDKEKASWLTKDYELFRAYGQSKLANLLFTTELARRLKEQGSNIPVNQIHPGEVLTEVMRDMHPMILQLYKIFQPVAYGFMKSASQGAFCTLYVATDEKLATARGGTGKHFIRLSPAPLSKIGRDREIAKKLWTLSEEVTGIQSVV